jgi:hypothetical protein
MRCKLNVSSLPAKSFWFLVGRQRVKDNLGVFSVTCYPRSMLHKQDSRTKFIGGRFQETLEKGKGGKKDSKGHIIKCSLRATEDYSYCVGKTWCHPN